MKRTYKRIRTLLLPFLLTLVLIFAFFIFRRDLNQNMQDSAYRSLAEIAMEHKSYFHCRLEGEWNILEALAASTLPGEARDDERLLAMMDQLVGDTGFQCFSIVEPDGTRISNDGHKDNISDFEMFQSMKEGEFAISVPMPSLVNGEEKEVIFMSCPVLLNGEVKYSIMGAYELSELSAVLLSAMFGGESYCTIIDSSGEVIVTNNHKNRLSNSNNMFDFYQTVDFKDSLTFSQMEENIKKGKQGTFSYEYNGTYRMGYYQPAGINDWSILSVTPQVIVNDRASSIAKIVNRLMFTVILAFLILVLWVFAKTKAESLSFKAKAERDGMTHLFNKATTENLIQNMLQVEEEVKHALFIFDIDDFKGINDTLGHSVGDQVIIKTASLLKEVFRPEDIVGRIGGDEFAVLYKNVGEFEALKKKAYEVVKAFETMEAHFNKPVSCSIGIAVSGGNLIQFTKLYKAADHALYQAKGQGKNQYAIYQAK